jgi:hypothetical protein
VLHDHGVQSPVKLPSHVFQRAHLVKPGAFVSQQSSLVGTVSDDADDLASVHRTRKSDASV